MTTISAGARATVALPAGATLQLLGTGTFQIIAPARPDFVTGQRSISPSGEAVGPFALDATVAIVAASSLSYETHKVGDLTDRDGDVGLTAAQVAAVQSLGIGAGNRTRRVRSMLGATPFDLMAVTGMPAGASFSGSGSYGSAGLVAVQSTGTVTHNANGWYDGTACLEFTPNTDSSAELRIYLGATGFDISDDDGLGFEFGIPDNIDTTLTNFAIAFDFSSDATNLFPSNTQYVQMWRCDQTVAQTKEKGGRKYVRNRWDATAATDAACGVWPGNIGTGVLAGTGADRTAMCKWIRFRANKFSGKTLKFKAIRLGGRSTPAFVMGSDNANPSQLFSAMAYLASKGLPGYLAQYTAGLTGTALAGYLRADAAGHEITGDDVLDRPLGSTIFTEAEMRAAVEGTKAGLAALGLSESKTWVANNNTTSYLMIRELARAGYVCNRNGATDGRYVYPEGGVPDKFRLPAITIDNLNWTAIQPMIDRAITTGCTLWIYWHGVLSSARVDADRTANVTGTAGAPAARSASESLAAYRARMVGLGAGIGAASVVYFDNRIGSASLGIWWEELKPMIDYLAPLNQDGTCAVVSPREWCADVGLLTA